MPNILKRKLKLHNYSIKIISKTDKTVSTFSSQNSCDANKIHDDLQTKIT